MDKKRILAAVDHTLLNVDATWEQVKTLCDEAVRYQVATVCLPPAYAAEAVDYLEGKLPVCVVVGFPNGYSTRAAKVFEAREAIDNGAAEIDMVINVGFLKSGRYDAVLREIRAVKDLCNEHILKVIVECCLLTEQEKIKMCELVTESGADYIKTSTGFSKGGATRDDVALLARHEMCIRDRCIGEDVVSGRRPRHERYILFSFSADHLFFHPAADGGPGGDVFRAKRCSDCLLYTS